MKKLLITLSIALLALASTAQITVNVPTAGGFSTALTTAGGDANTVTNIIVTGNIDARDVKFMRDNMPLLAILDLSAVQIIAYTGTGGTYPSSTTYPTNEMPRYSFSNPDTDQSKTSLTNIKLPNSITSIGYAAFEGCSKLTGSLTIPSSITSIGADAFYGCNGFTGSLTIPNSVASIGADAFYYCYGFTGSLTIPNSVTSIGAYAFYYCYGFTGSLNIPNSVTSIGDGAFYDCRGLTGSLTIPNSITSIGDAAFYGCRGLTGNLTIPNSVSSIGNFAFFYCSSFTGSLIIPNSVTSIGKRAFESCRGFTGSLTIPNSLTSIGNSAFASCDRINSIEVDENNTNFSSIDGVLFNKAKTTLIQCPVSKVSDSYIIPNSVTSIEENAFDGCIKLTGSLIIPNSVTSIGDYAFSACVGFTSLSIPNSVTSIGDYAFNYCSGLQKIIVTKLVPLGIYQYTFGNVNKTTCELVAPVGSKAAYQTANYWKDFTNITELNNALLVHYNSQGGSTVNDVAAELNTKTSAPSTPIKTGYTFAGWFKEGVCTNIWDFATDLVTTNTTLYAKWAITVSFNSQGGGTVNDLVVELNTKISAPSAPTKTGCTFAGWYKETTCTNAWDFTTELVSTNTILYAKWTINTYTVSFNSQDGTAVSNITALYSTKITSPDAPTKTGYTFAGWYKEEDCTNSWNFTTNLVTSNITLYAKWTINTCTISFNSLGGSVVSDITALYNTKITSPGATTKTGYNFAGWYKEVACTNAWNFATDLVTSNITLYAKWTASPTAVANIDASSLRMFPNPASEFVKIESEKLQTITIYNLKGATQQQIDLHGEESVNVNLNHLSPGYYFVKVKTNDGAESIMKLMKN